MFCPVFCVKNGTFLQHLFARYVAKQSGCSATDSIARSIPRHTSRQMEKEQDNQCIKQTIPKFLQHILQINVAKMSRFLRKKRDKTFNFKCIRSLAELLWQHYAQETYGSGAIWNATIGQITEQIGAKLPKTHLFCLFMVRIIKRKSPRFLSTTKFSFL